MTSEDEEIQRRLQDPLWRFRHLHHIKNEETGAVIPFSPFPEQEQVFKAVKEEGHQRIIIPKARRRGMSTGIGVMMADTAMENAGFEGGIVDRNQSEATKKLSNITKVTFNQMPEFIKSDIKFGKYNDDQVSFSVGGDTDSHIYASTTYRGGNCNFLHVSEWGWIQCEDPKRSEEIQTGAIQAARKGQIIVETTWKGGKHGHLWDYTEQALETPEEDKHARSWRIMFFPWHTDPVYQLESSLKIRTECEDYFQELELVHGIPLTIAQKRWYQDEAWPLRNNRFGEYPSVLEECFRSPMDGVIYEMEMAAMLAERRITSIPVEKGMPVFVSFDLGRNDAMPMTFVQPIGKELRVVGYHVSHRETIKYYGAIIREWMREHSVEDVSIILPHDGGRVSLETGNTLVQAFQEMGFVNVQSVNRIPSIWAGINYVKDTFPYLWIDSKVIQKKFTRGSKKFPSLGECLNNYHQAQQANGMMMSMEPVHDDYSHGPDSLRTFCEAWQKGQINRVIGRATQADFMSAKDAETKLAGSRKFR